MRTGRPQPRCIMPDRSMRSRSWHPAQKAHSESARSPKSRPPNNRCHLLRTQKVQIRCARSPPIVTKGAQRAHGPPAAPMHDGPDRTMRSRSWHPAQKPHSESAKEHQKQAPHNRCHLLRTQKVQNRCARSRPIARKGAQRAHGPPAAPMHHACSQHARSQLASSADSALRISKGAPKAGQISIGSFASHTKSTKQVR